MHQAVVLRGSRLMHTLWLIAGCYIRIDAAFMIYAFNELC
jgi:hypothetical protein